MGKAAALVLAFALMSTNLVGQADAAQAMAAVMAGVLMVGLTAAPAAASTVAWLHFTLAADFLVGLAVFAVDLTTVTT